MKKLFPLLVFLAFLLPHSASATVYYVDFNTASTTMCQNNGLATTSPYCSVRQFTEVARNAGDIAIVRRGFATTTGITAAALTSSGTVNNPIMVTADYDNLWNGFATTSETYTPVFGSTYMAGSASSTLIATSTWIYVGNDCHEVSVLANATGTNTCEFAYEIRAASSTGIQLYLPYKGNQSAAGNKVRVMGTAPQIGTITTAAQIISSSGDNYWIFKGLDMRGTNAICEISTSNDAGNILFDTIFQGDGVTDCAFAVGQGTLMLKKTRSFGQLNFFGAASAGKGIMKDVFVDCNNVASSVAFASGNFGVSMSVDSGEVINCATFFSSVATVGNSNNSYFSGVKRNNVIPDVAGDPDTHIFFEDDFSMVGLNSQTEGKSGAGVSTTTISDTSQLRSGGGPTTQKILPPAGTGSTGVSVNLFPFSYLKLFEYPIYAAANVSKTYSMFFMSTSTANFGVNPLTAASSTAVTPEMYIECEYYADTFDAARKLLRSSTAAAINFTGSTAWQSISVTCNPSQSGILYLRGWYAKPQEGSGKTNIFFMDTTPVVS